VSINNPDQSFANLILSSLPLAYNQWMTRERIFWRSKPIRLMEIEVFQGNGNK